MNTALRSLLLSVAVVVWLLRAHAAEPKPGAVHDSVGVRPKTENLARKPATRVAKRQAPNPLVYPPYKAQLPAVHSVHAGRLKLTCEACHAKAKTSRSSSDWLGPTSDQCVACHEHQFDDVRVMKPPKPRMRFSHAKHAARKIDCAVCHGRVNERSDARGSEQFPMMAVCLRCHDSDRGALASHGGNCRLCHVQSGGVIQSRFREGRLVPSSTLGSMRHDTGWLWQHGDAAMIRGPVCLACHQESECVSCHNGKLRPRNVHPSDWLGLHGIEARQQGGACNSCHRSQSECLSCHLRAGLSPSGPLAARSTRGRFHPPSSVWTDRPRTGRHHAIQARLHMDECVSCHQERDCASCHASAGVGGPGQGGPMGSAISPHPLGFRSMCGGLLTRNPRPCFVCHRPDDPNLIPCR